MIRKLCIILVAALIAAPLCAQDHTVWVQQYNGGLNGAEEKPLMALDDSGNVFVSGLSWEADTFQYFTTIKYDAGGEVQWINHARIAFDKTVSAMTTDHLGNVYVTGYSDYSGRYAIMTMAYDSNGDSLWVRQYGNWTSVNKSYDITVDVDQNVYVLGASNEYADQTNQFIIKYDYLGTLQWVSYYKPDNYDGAWGDGITIGPSGDIYTVGTCCVSICKFFYYFTLTKFDAASGDLLWEYVYEPNVSYGRDLFVDPNGDIYAISSGTHSGILLFKYSQDLTDTLWVRQIIGQTSAGQSALAVDLNGNAYVCGYRDYSSNDYLVVKHSPDGDSLWTQIYDSPVSGDDIPRDIVVDSSGNIYVTGQSIADGDWNDYMTIMYDTYGSELWVERYNGPGNMNDEASAIAVDNQGNIYITGKSYGDGSDYDFSTIKYYDPTPYPIKSFAPEKNELNVPVISDIVVSFFIDMDETTIDSTTFIVNAMSTGFHTGVISYDAPTKTATFNPDDDFAVGEVVTVELITGIESSQGIPLEISFIWNFTVEVDDGPGNFVIDSTYTTGVRARDVASADVDNDGDLDLAVVHDGTRDIYILMNNGDGTFTPDSTYAVDKWALKICAADFNYDGDIDLAVANFSDSSLSVLMNLGEGVFGPDTQYLLGGTPLSVTAADLDGDGDWDLITALYDADSFTILWNNGQGIFDTDTSYATGDGAASVCAADINGDGTLDLITTGTFSYKVFIHINDGDNKFPLDTSYWSYKYPRRLELADLDGDNDLDMATTHYESDTISVYFNTGEGIFEPYVTYVAGDDVRSIRAGDLDGDLDLDLYTANMNSDDVSVLWNDGNGNFPERTDFPTGDGPFSALASDLDGDGDLDLATANLSNSVTVLFNHQKPEVLAVFPLINTLNVVNDADITAMFNIDMDPESINESTFVVTGEITGLHAGMINYDDLSMTATLNPDNDFATGEVVTAVLTTDIESSFSQKLERSIVWSFTIEATSGDAIFDPDSTYQSLGSPISSSLGDFNGDGYIDLAFSNDIDLAAANKSGSGSGILDNISIYLNDGTGEFILDSSLFDILLSQFVSADIDNDLDLDLIGIDDSLKNIRTYKNNGGGRFYPDSVYDVGGEPVYLVSFDADGDGDPDLAVADADSNRVLILSNDGEGNFGLSTWCDISGAPQMLWTGDFDRDAYTDIAVLSTQYDSVYQILTNTGTGTFEAGAAVPFLPLSSFIGTDVDGNGRPDLIGTFETSSQGPGISVHCSNEDGSFWFCYARVLNAIPKQLSAADINADGHLDMVVAYVDYDSISVLLNDGTGYFDSCYSYSTGGDDLSMAIPVDIDNSGSMDIVVASKDSYRFSTLSNTLCDCRPGDANGDGSVNVGDATYIISYIFKGGPSPTPYEICSGDANCNCQVDPGDAVYIINYVFKGGPPPCSCEEWVNECGWLLRK